MSLSLDKSPGAEFLRFMARFSGVVTGSAATGPVRVRLAKQNELYQLNTIVRHFARQADREAELCGANAFETAQIAMWMDVAQQLLVAPSFTLWGQLEAALDTRTYFVANRVTLADGALFWAVYNAVKTLSGKQRAQFVNVLRWFDQLQHTAGVRGFPNLDIVPLERKQYALTV